MWVAWVPAMTVDAYICDYVRTPIGRYGGALASVRADDLAALPIRELLRRHPGYGRGRRRSLPWLRQPGGRGQPELWLEWPCCWRACRTSLPGATVNRLCASGMDAVAAAARAIKSSEIDLAIAGGSESMTRAPFVMGKGGGRVPAFGRTLRHDHRLALRQSADEDPPWRRFDARNGQNVADEFRFRARIRTPSRCARKAARRRGAGNGRLARRDRPRRDQGPQGRRDSLRPRRASARGYDASKRSPNCAASCARTAA